MRLMRSIKECYYLFFIAFIQSVDHFYLHCLEQWKSLGNDAYSSLENHVYCNTIIFLLTLR